MDKIFIDEYEYSIETNYKSIRSHVSLQWKTEVPMDEGWYQACIDDRDVLFVYVDKSGKIPWPDGKFLYKEDSLFTGWLGPLPFAKISEDEIK